MITLPSLNDLPSRWNEIREQLETDFPVTLEALLHERLTEHEAKQFEQDFIDRIGCTPEEYVRIRRAIRLLEARYPDSPNELTAAAVATPLGEMLAVFGSKGLCLLEFFATPLETIGTAFQQQVWNALLTIPYGETRSYKEQAQQLGNPKAVRAVAAANGQNKVSILIPCHRVIGSDGKLTGYAGGLNRKQSLLALERGEVQTALF